MKTVLVLAYYFPPLGLGGTQRVAKFVKYLPEFGWQPYVVTVKETAYYAYDPSLLHDVRAARVVRTGSLDPQRLLARMRGRGDATLQNGATSPRWRLGQTLANWVLIPDSKVLWLPFALAKAHQVVRRERVACVLTTSPPHSVHLAGLWLKRLTGKPWVADFRDGWSGGQFQSEPTAWHRAWNRRLEGAVLRRADAVVGVSRKLVETLRSRTAGADDKFHVIPNGYDPDDFAGLLPARNREKMRVVYCGALTAAAPLTGFLEALKQALQKSDELRARFELVLVGANLTPELTGEIRALYLEDYVRFTGYVEHRAAVEKLLQADVLLYSVADWAGEDFVPGKTFEYLAAGRPVLAVGPRVEGTEILERTGRIARFGHADVAEMERYLLEAFAWFKAGKLAQPDVTGNPQYERKTLTEHLARVLNRVVGNVG